MQQCLREQPFSDWNAPKLAFSSNWAWYGPSGEDCRPEDCIIDVSGSCPQKSASADWKVSGCQCRLCLASLHGTSHRPVLRHDFSC
eukprot:5347778-Alexandrium_andersonii.AAC.1